MILKIFYLNNLRKLYKERIKFIRVSKFQLVHK